MAQLVSNKAAKEAERKLLATLLELGGSRQQEDALSFSGDKFVLPKNYENRPIGAVIEFLEDYDNQQNQEFMVERKFPYHPYDVADAFQKVLKAVFGTSGFGKDTFTFFGKISPEYHTVRTSATGDTVQVPWGRVALPILKATFSIGHTENRDGLPIGHIVCSLPKRFRGHLEGVFKAMEAHLRANSIFRGKAIDANWMDPEFIDLTSVDPARVVFNYDTKRQIEANIWAVMRHAERIVRLGMPLKRAVLLEGPYGCGKSLTGVLTAQEAVARGWTFVNVRPGQDIGLALQSARLLAPAVVFFEDLDVIAQPNGNDDGISKLLDTFDGISSKSNPVIAVLTTNHVEKLHKGMLRPGRLDAVIHIGVHDHDAIIELVKTLVPEGSLAANIDWDQVAGAMNGYLPAFIKEAVDRALRYAVSRTETDDEIDISTEDLVDAAAGLRPQLDLMSGASEQKQTTALVESVAETVRVGTLQAMEDSSFEYDNDRDSYVLRTNSR